MTDTRQLLADYTQNGSESAFRELVTRYLDLVYSTACRLVDGDAHRARDVAQVVFVDLAAKARNLPPEIMLGGWLHRHTCYVAANTMRGERRRLTRERQAVEMNALENNSTDDFSRLAPVLDDVIDALDAPDRAAILLRFYEQRDFRAIGETLGTSEDAARMRVNRALEKLQQALKTRGIQTTATALSVTILAGAVQAAPAGLAATVATAALAGTAVSTAAATITTTKIIAMTTLQKITITAALAALAGAGLYETHQAAVLKQQNESLQQQQSDLAGQVQQLQRERDDATNRLTTLLADARNSQPDPQKAEVLKLRGEVTNLRNQVDQADDPIVKKALRWKANAEKMKLLFAEHPDQQVPEMKLLSDDYFFDLARDQDLESSNGVRKAFSEIRMRAKNTFAYPLQQALSKYINENNGKLPDTVAALKPYFDNPVDDAMLDQYKMMYSGKMSDVKGNFVLKDKQVVDPELDDAWEVGPNAYGPASTDRAAAEMKAAAETLQPAIESYQQAHGGAMPTDLSQLKPLITTPEQQAAYDQLSKNNASLGQPN